MGSRSNLALPAHTKHNLKKADYKSIVYMVIFLIILWKASFSEESRAGLDRTGQNKDGTG